MTLSEDTVDSCKLNYGEEQFQLVHESNGVLVGEQIVRLEEAEAVLDERTDNRRRESRGQLCGPGWKARGDRKPTEVRRPFTRPTLRQIFDALPFIIRYFCYWIRRVRRRENLFINTFQPLSHKPHYGVPCGSIGTGSIGRDFRGGFCKFGLRPGRIEQNVGLEPADQFILTVRRDNATEYQRVLCAYPVSRRCGASMRSWVFDFPERDITYRGLYPRSWTHYEVGDSRLSLICRQVSPVIPHNYQESSLPVSLFVWEVQNDGAEPLDVSLTFTFRNGTGYSRWQRECRCSTYPFHFPPPADAEAGVKGVCLKHTIDSMPCTYAVAAKETKQNKITTCVYFNPSGSGQRLWDNLWNDGQLQSTADDMSAGCREMGVAVCSKLTVPGNSSAVTEFALAWDMPLIHFGKRGRKYKRRYTRWYGADCAAGPELCRHALAEYKQWEEKIDAWQRPILDHALLPDWYKAALFNELYFITDGGSIWVEFDEEWMNQETQLSEYSAAIMKDYGRFGYLESWEYRMINTYDVHFYASFALAQLWPRLEHCVQSEYTDYVFHSNYTLVKYHFDGTRRAVKTASRVPHDLGNPADDPWLMTNAYMIHDTACWKDLNLKFVLTTYRDYLHVMNEDKTFLKIAWPACQALIAEGLEKWDRNADCMIENGGVADQTYDAWTMKGVSSYCGSLWLAALLVCQRIAEIFGETDKARFYRDTLHWARRSYQEKLWTVNQAGSYYKFDELSGSSSSIMADQLCGYWFMDATNPLDAEKLLPRERVVLALKTIYRMNVQGFADGRLGAVNGMRPDGQKDRTCVQSDEVWTGVTYALAAFLVQQGLVEEGLQTASGIYDACFERFGLQYQTPEAIYEQRFYRAIGYMRPLSIWAIQWALEKRHGFPNLDPLLFAASEQQPSPNDL